MKNNLLRKLVYRIKYPIVFIVLPVCGLTLSFWIAKLDYKSKISSERDHAILDVEQIRNNLSREIYAAVNLTQGIIALVQMQGGITDKQFTMMAKKLMEHNRLIKNAALAPDNIVKFIYPLEKNKRVIGLDYSKVPQQYKPIQKAIQSRSVIVAGPVQLVQGGIGIIGRTPIFVDDTVSMLQQTKYWGMASTVIDFNMLINQCGLHTLEKKYRLSLRGIDAGGASGKVFWGDADVLFDNPVSLEVMLPSGSWIINAVPSDGWPVYNPFLCIKFIVCIVFTAFITYFLLLLMKTSDDRANEISKRIVTGEILQKKNRALRLFSECNNVVVHAVDEQILLKDICRIAVRTAGYRLAWVGKAEYDDFKTILPVTFEGPGIGFLDKIRVSWGDNEYGKGTAGNAIRSGKPAIARNILNNSCFTVWHDVLLERDFASAIAIPLNQGGRIYGVLLIYAAEPDAFDETEVELLEQLGSNISHGMTAINAEKERLAAEKKQAETEAQLRQSQKLDTLGQLSGVIAHDFNNLLAAIMGYCNLIETDKGNYTELDTRISRIVKCTDRAANLTRQLLAFSRKQVLEPKVINVNQVIREHEDILKRLTGETIHTEFIYDPCLRYIKADIGQIEQVMMNLVVNARDAMPDGGKLIIETKNVESGSGNEIDTAEGASGKFIMLRVSDSGCGMGEDVKARIFEPFFTTKEAGKGTGLGLATVFGIVKQSGGTISCDSIIGHGTTFSIYLPATGERLENSIGQHIKIDRSQLTGREYVLVVEDENAILDVVCRMLAMSGYQVSGASSGTEALQLIEQKKEIVDLLITDVVLPGMDGLDLTKKIKQLKPQIKVLFISGYAYSDEISKEIASSGASALQKPFTIEMLRKKVRMVLNNESG